jgi:predicted ester cyclase
MNDIERTVRQFHESRDLRDQERGVAVIAPDCRFADVARNEAQIGPDGYRHDDHRWRAAFPDGEVKVVNVITGSDGWAVLEFVNRGTQTGPLQSSLGDFPASGRRMEVRYCAVMRIQDGKVFEGRDYDDCASIARQPGLVP